MKIERINENQIRCTLTSFDLSVRNLNLGELAYGSEKARNLFREMIQKASNEVGFEAEDIPLMVEAIPLSNESVMLVITKIEDPEELDTRFSKFSPAHEEESLLDSFASELLEGADGLLPLGGAAQILFGDHLGDHHADDHEEQENTGQGDAVVEHDGQRADDGSDRHDQLQQAGLEHVGDLVQVAGHTAQDLAGFVLVKKAKGKPV